MITSTVHFIPLDDALQEALGVGATTYEIISNVCENDRAIGGR